MAPPVATELTLQQLEYLHRTSLGWDTQRIARYYHVTKGSVNMQLYRAYRKLGAIDSAHAVLIACWRGLIGPNADDLRFTIDYRTSRMNTRTPVRRVG